MRDKAIVSAFIKTATTFIVLIALILGYFAASFGWFANNENVNVNGNVITADGISVEITQVSSVGGIVADSLAVNFSDLFPGDTVSAIIDITCYKEIESISIFLSAPQGCETPVVSEGKNYYFGSQILITSILFEGSSLSVNALNKSLLSKTPDSDWGTTQNLIPTDIEICTLNSLAVGTYTVELEFSFYNAPYNQNVLKNFGKVEGQTCYRIFQIK